MLGFLPLFGGVADASHGVARDTADACPSDAPNAFTDDEGNTHEANINCIAFWDITQGTTATTYSPRSGTRRDQMATFIANLIDTAADGGGTALPASPPDAFTDDTASVHHNNINRLAAAEVVNGTTATTYSPAALVTRAQMATFIAQAIDYVNDGDVDGDQPPATTNNHFTDDDTSVHHSNINRIAEQHIVVGTGGGNFTPSGIVFRDQMASFLAQAADFLASLGFWPPLPGVDVTSRPELVSASVVSTTTTGINAGTVISYTFDEAVTCINEDGFHAVTNAGVRYDGDVCLTSGSNATQQVRFTDGDLTSASTAAALTLATVDGVDSGVWAVEDTAGEENPEGDASLNAQGSTALPAGTTAAPDLVSVGTFAAATTTMTFVTFTFDEAATNIAGGTGYHLIDTTGDFDIEGTLDSGDGTTAHQVLFANADLGGQTGAITSGQISRGYVESSTVDDGVTDNENAKQAADVSNSGNTGLPDLVSASFNLDAVVSGAAKDQATLVFDQAVANPGVDVTDFSAYLASGFAGEINPETAGFSTATPTQVLLTFANGDLTGAVGIFIDDDAVLAASGPNTGEGNQDDEVGVANTTAAQQAGRTTDPDLISVTRSAETDIFGNPTGDFVFSYAFDEDIDDTAVDATLFYLYLADGTLLLDPTCTSASGTTSSTDHIVTCTDYDDSRTSAAATPSVHQGAVLGTVDDGAVEAETGGAPNHEGAEPVQNA